MPDVTPIPRNLLGDETSPYLLQHAANPVHWRPWGAAALAEAQAAGKPILLSVGYAACHWCHVMAHESFEDAETAALMNRLFVNVKVDREERPEIDAAYMHALHLLGEQGGWPLTMFLTPGGEPFWGGTYFPPEPRWGRPSFRQVLAAVAAAHAGEPDKVAQNAAALRAGLARMAAGRQGGLPDRAAMERVTEALLGLQDRARGGLQGAPKFPNPPIYRFLCQMARRLERPEAMAALHLLLQRMAQGGIWDHLGGGFARYSVDARWLVPHFEKMLYDNAQLLELLALAQADRPHPLYARRAAELVGWLEREMVAEGGAYAASLDADSEGEEGRFYVWTKAEVEAVLGADAPAFAAAYDVTDAGNWEGKVVLNRSQRPDLQPEAAEAALAAARARLLAAREGRPRPGRDDKILADWNALAVCGLVRAAAAFDRPDWLAMARRVFGAVAGMLAAPDGRLWHSWREGRPGAAGLLEDHADMARAALALQAATGEARFLDLAIGWIDACERHFAAPDGGAFASADDAADVLFRVRGAGDGPTPAGNGVLAEVQARLFHLTGDPSWARRAEATIGAFAGQQDGLAGMTTLLAAADLLVEGPSVVLAGPAEGARPLLAVALATPDPAVTVLQTATGQDVPGSHPAAGKGPVEGRAAAYVCQAGRCGLPVVRPEELARLLGMGAGVPAGEGVA
ncbi:thioredoxin domain-containing protein [Roseomonas sp. OT10]|uniref:thioredoxin domain-containing protein n=1 Tax=Roseomonas cutis TaxID=2897332 RepID=UPI001E63A9BF|nr:thioredoxin domain-containing protein [Roseomonas sp. OT10]UFN49725.1 thioredoxin domain-containing protein [Roseomonas sp. OT10]